MHSQTFDPLAGKVLNRRAIHSSAKGAKDGGEGGIRTHGTLSGSPDFESGTLDHSATSPIEASEGGTVEGALEKESRK
jgi:hypothetical protein